MKGLFKMRPSIPKYNCTWDPNLVLNHFKSLNYDNSLKLCSHITVTLLLLCSARRGKEIIDIHIDNISFTKEDVIIRFGDLQKTTKPNISIPIIHLKKFSHDPKVCIYSWLKEYLNKTSSLRKGEKQLFISYQKPFKAISRDTLSRWVKSVLEQSGVNISKFTTHTLRNAATRFSASKNLSLTTIMSTVGWRHASTFTTFYKRPVLDKEMSFCEAILQE